MSNCAGEVLLNRQIVVISITRRTWVPESDNNLEYDKDKLVIVLNIVAQKRVGNVEARLHILVNSILGDRFHALKIQAFFLHVQCFLWWEHDMIGKCKTIG